MKEIKRKLLSKLLISRALTFDISATECPIEIKFSVLDSAGQELPTTYPIIKGILNIASANRATLTLKWSRYWALPLMVKGELMFSYETKKVASKPSPSDFDGLPYPRVRWYPQIFS